MQIQWIPTNDYYHEIIQTPDPAARISLYRERFITPWKPMMDMVGSMFQTESEDALAVARAWAWVMPEDLTAVPAALADLEAADGLERRGGCAGRRCIPLGIPCGAAL